MVHYAPVKIRALSHVSLYVRDLGATRRFYRDLLGLTETGTGKKLDRSSPEARLQRRS